MRVKGERQIKEFVGRHWRKNKRPSWIDENYWVEIKMLNPFVCVLQQKDLTEWVSRSKCLEELHKHQKGEKKGTKEDAEASGTTMPDDLQLMAIVAGGVSCNRFYGTGMEAAHFITENKQAAIGLVSCCLDHEQRLMRRVKDVISRVSAAFDEHMQWLFENNQLVYNLFPSMMPLVRAAMSNDTSTSTSTVAVAGTSEVRTQDSNPPLLYPTPRIVLPHPLQMLHRLHFDGL
ncbi:hypothetical protein M9H77_01947 [Catharanthus roseus]|uniref:Uncharacterized protein n=1 Tax=Catharanthus roseus TaxID=4058 RepID=A0ACC0C6Z8_CATRO|nr:hypothetical protein M9H77_01947 [Catharanthus roseus]